MAVTLSFRRSSRAQQTDEVYILLVTLDHPDLSVDLRPFRFSSDGVDTVSRGNTYIAYPFYGDLPEDTEDLQGEMRLYIDNVDRKIVEGLRSILEPPTVTIELVLASDPDTVEMGPREFELIEGEYTSAVVTGRLVEDTGLDNAWPYPRFTPRTTPGIFD